MSNATRKQPKRLAAALAAALGLVGLQSGAFASVLSVTSCADDGSAGSLRQVAAQAVQGDTIDLSGLSCVGSTVTLTQGEIVLPYNVTLNGPASADLTVAASGSRVFTSTSTDKPAPYLAIQNLKISGGRVSAFSDDVAGGCIMASGRVTLNNSSVADCSANSDYGSARGGGIFADSVELVSSRVSGNSANAPAHAALARGGGIYVTTSLYCKDSTISGNTALAESESDMADGGGAMLFNANLDMYRCTVDGNAADRGAGLSQLVLYGPNQTTLIANSTISGNVASSPYSAAGLQVFCPDCAPADVQINNSTIAFNGSQSTYTAGVFTNGSIVAQSSIIANNTGAGGIVLDAFAHRFAGASNLVMSNNAPPEAGAVVSSADPLLEPLADNGGATRTHALTASSPALGAGSNPLDYLTDQRGNGFWRTFGGSVDIGAFQTQAAAPARAAGDAIFAGSFND